MRIERTLIERNLKTRSGGLALPVVVGLLYVGLVRLIVMPVRAYSSAVNNPDMIHRLLAGGGVTGSLLTINLLLIGFLAVSYLGRRVDRGASLADNLGFFGTALLVVYLSYGLL